MPDEKDDDMLRDPMDADDDIIIPPKKNPLDPDEEAVEDDVEDAEEGVDFDTDE